MTLYRAFWRISLSMALAALTWLVWQSPQPAVRPPAVKVHLPLIVAAGKQAGVPGQRLVSEQSIQPEQSKLTEQTGNTSLADAPSLWRVVTHRVISNEGIHALQQRLAGMGLDPVSIHTTEEMTMHAFDDAALFSSRAQAQVVAAFWQQHDIDTNIIKAAKGTYLLALGRYYQSNYAALLQQQLDRAGRPYRYQQRKVPIPVVRFTFPASPKGQADALWKKLNSTGIVMPVEISEQQFNTLYKSARLVPTAQSAHREGQTGSSDTL